MKITARHITSLKVVDLYYKSMEEAKTRNPYLKDFRWEL